MNQLALGDTVNTAARLESVNKQLGTLICVSDATLSDCERPVPARPVGRLVLKGKKQALLVYEPLPEPLPAGHAPTALYQEAYDAMRAGDVMALALFERLLQRHPDDPLVALHAARLAQQEQGDLIVLSRK